MHCRKATRFLSLVLSLIFCLTLLPMDVLAADTGYKFIVTSNLDFGSDENSTTNPYLVLKSGSTILDINSTIDTTKNYAVQIQNSLKLTDLAVTEVMINGVSVTVPPASTTNTFFNLGTIPGIINGSNGDASIRIRNYDTKPANAGIFISFGSVTPQKNIEIYFEFSPPPDYNAPTVGVATADTEKGTLADPKFIRNIGGGSTWRLTATPAVGYQLAYIQARDDESTRVDSNDGTTITWDVTRDGAEYTAYFTQANFILEALVVAPYTSSISGINHGQISSKPISAGQRVGLCLQYSIPSETLDGTAASFRVYAGTDTSAAPLVSHDQIIGGSAGRNHVILVTDSMPQVNQVTVTAKLGAIAEPVQKTYDVTVAAPGNAEMVFLGSPQSSEFKLVYPSDVKTMIGGPNVYDAAAFVDDVTGKLSLFLAVNGGVMTLTDDGSADLAYMPGMAFYYKDNDPSSGYVFAVDGADKEHLAALVKDNTGYEPVDCVYVFSNGTWQKAAGSELGTRHAYSYGLVMSQNDIWVSDKHWNGDSWSEEGIPAGVTFNSFWKQDADTAYAGSEDGLYKYSGGAWSKVDGASGKMYITGAVQGADGSVTLVTAGTYNISARASFGGMVSGTVNKVVLSEGGTKLTPIDISGIADPRDVGSLYVGVASDGLWAATYGRSYYIRQFGDYYGANLYKYVDGAWQYQIVDAFNDATDKANISAGKLIGDKTTNKSRPDGVRYILNPCEGVTLFVGNAGAIYAGKASSTITFNTDGGSDVSVITGTIGSSVTAPVSPTKSAYNFSGWYADAGLSIPYSFAEYNVMPAKDITLHARWIPKGGANTLAEERTRALDSLDVALAKFKQTDYITSDWNTLIEAYNSGKSNINSAETYDDIYAALNSAIAAMAGVQVRNPALTSISLADGESGAAITLSPVFDADTLEYTAAAENVSSVKVTLAAVSDTASIQVNGNQVVSGSASDAIAFTDGRADINVVVTDGDLSRTYTITVSAQVDPHIVITHDSACGKVQEYSYEDRILVYDCSYDELETIFKATAYPEGSGNVEFKKSSSSLYSFNAETGVLKLNSDRVKIDTTITAALKDDPTVTTTETFVFRRSLKQIVPEKVEIELPEDGSDYTYILDAGSDYMDYGGMNWEFPENDYFTGVATSPFLFRAQITPKRPGTADIYVTDVLTETRVKVQVTVTGTGVVTEHGGRAEAKLAGNGNSAEDLQLLAYSNLEEDSFTWTSDDESIAAVDQNGLVTPKKVGIVMIRAQSDGTGKSAWIKVLVRADGARYLDGLIFAPGTKSTEKFVTPLVFEPTVLEYPDLLCPVGGASSYYGGLYVFPTFDSKNIEAAMIYTDADGKPTEAILGSGNQTIINNCLQAGENEITINLTEKSSGRVTSYLFTVIRPLSLVNRIDYASLKPFHRDAAAYPRYIPPVEADKPITQTVQEGVVYTVATKTGTVTEGIGSSSYSGVFKDTSAIDLNINKAMPKEAVVRVKNSLTGAIYPESSLTNIPLDEGDKTIFLIEVMSGKSAAENPDSFVVDASYTLTVYKLDLPPVDMSGVYFTSADFSDGCIFFTPPAAFDPQTATSAKLLIPNQGDSWVDVTLPEDVELYLGSVLPENKVTASEGVYRIPLEPDSVTAILTLEVDGYRCEKPYTFNIMRRGTLAVPDGVADYLCAPSQYTNAIGDYGGSPEGTLLGTGVGTYYSVKSLGNFGGYIAYYYEDAINNSPNNPYGVDFIVYGNSVDGGQGFSEPGNVLVSQDGETWYSLAGSDHFDDNVIWNYPVTYTKQADGKAGYSHAYGAGVWGPYPNWNNYPLTENRGDSFTLTGSLMMGALDMDDYGSSMAGYPDWGYADVSINGTVDGNAFNPYDKGAYRANGFDLDWAVDADGQPVKLDSVNYVKVETASFIIAGAIGEKSTEVNCVVKTNASASEVGVTPAPQSITVNGKAVNLEAGVNSYDVKLDSLNSAFTVAVDAPEGSNIYINNQRGTSREFEKAPRERIVRVIVQEGEKEPAIYYLNLSENQPEPENTPPVLKEGVGPTAEAEVTVGTAYELDLSTIFEDADNDELTHSVSVDGAAAVSAEANYSYTPSETGSYTLVFKANDGNADSETYTVTLTVREDTSGDIEEAQKVDDLITAISDLVTLADKEAIEEARAAYNALTDSQKNLVTKLEQLQNAEAALEDLEAAKEVDDQIASISDPVTLADKEAIEEARVAYDALTPAQADLVSNYQTLTAAEAAYAALVAEKEDADAAKEVDDLIAEISDPVTLADKVKIEEARAAYNALTDPQKNLVTKLDQLEAAEAKLADLQAAKAVEDKIAALGTVTLESTDAIEEARAAYNALTDSQKNLVTKLEQLQNAEAALEDLEAAKEVDDQIASISDPVTLADKAKIEEARAAYDALTDPQKDLVTKLAQLEAAEAKLADLIKPVQDVQQQIEELPAALGNTEAEMLALYQASRAFGELTAEQKAALSPDLQAKLAALQKQAAEINHTSNGVQINGLPWNIILTAEPIKGGADYEAMKKEAENKLGTDRTILGMYDLTLQELTADGLVEYLLDGETATITITVPDLAKYKEIKIIHQLADGSFEYIEPSKIEGNKVTFTVKSLSNYAIVGQLAEKDLEPVQTPGDEQGKPSTEDKGKKAPKTGDFNSALPALLLLFALCAGGYLYCRRGKEGNRL